MVKANDIGNPNMIHPGQRLVIVVPGPSQTSAPTPLSGVTYVVHGGDTLTSIGQRYGVDPRVLSQINGLGTPFLIRIGQSLVIPNPGVPQPSATAATPAGPSNTVQPPATPTGATTGAASLGGVLYTVAPGDTLSALAERFSVSAAVIAAANKIGPASYLIIGQVLSIPAVQPVPEATTAPAPVQSQPTSTYTVQAGDTLSAIGWRFGTSAEALAARNGISIGSYLQVGQNLIVPGGQEPFVTKTEVESVLVGEAQRAGIDPALVKAIAWQESGWQMVTAGDGGMGVMQLMPDSVTWASNTLLGYTVNPYNVVDNVRAGVAILHYYLGVYPDAQHAIAAYHQGMASVDNVGILPETQGYVANVLALQQQFGG
jgi:LysM repeat protein